MGESESKQIDLGYEGLEHCWVKGDAILLAEMCANLIDNAIKYTPEKGIVTVRIVEDESHKSMIKVEVEDSGPGIENKYIHRSLKAFMRLNNAKGLEGSGLGLALVKISPVITAQTCSC